jgi:hypothetical protein
MNDGAMTAEEMRWFALGAGAVLILLAVLSQVAQERWRLVAAAFAVGAAAGTGSFAVYGPSAKFLTSFSMLNAEEILILRVIAAGLTLWSLSIAWRLLARWWRAGDRVDRT